MVFLLRGMKHFPGYLVAEPARTVSIKNAPDDFFRTVFLFLSIAFHRTHIVIDYSFEFKRRLYVERSLARAAGFAGAGKN
jgi:hypothetical protein